MCVDNSECEGSSSNTMATAIDLDFNTWVGGEIACAGDEVWYKFVADAVGVHENGGTGKYTITTQGSLDTMGYLYDANGCQRIRFVDEFFHQTVYILDPVWGGVKSVAKPNGTTVTDEYNEDMSAMTKRRFLQGKDARNTSIDYGAGNLIGIEHGDISFQYGYLNGILSSVNRNGNMIENHTYVEKSNGDTAVTNYYGEYTKYEAYDKYGRLKSVSSILECTYGINPRFFMDEHRFEVIESSSAMLASVNDTIMGEVTKYGYENEKITRAQTANDSWVVRDETYQYDDLKRVTTDTVQLPTLNKVFSTVYEYDTTETDVNADQRVKTTTYHVDDAEKAKTTNTFDLYKRVRNKEVVLPNQKTFKRNYAYQSTQLAGTVDYLTDMHGTALVCLHDTQYAFDTLNRLTAETDHYTSTHVQYQYDEYGQIVRENNKCNVTIDVRPKIKKV